MTLLIIALFSGAITTLAEAGPAGAASSSEASFPASWREGDFWDLEVRRQSRAWMDDLAGAPLRKAPAERPSSYQLRVSVAGTEKYDNQDCWLVDFTPQQQGAAIGGPYRVLVSRETGWPCRVMRDGQVQGLLTERFGQSLFVTGAPEGFPLEFLPLCGPADLEASRPATVLQVRRRQLPEVTVMEATLRVGNRHDLYVKQVWKRGEKFWREYERYYRGHKDLEARVVSVGTLASGGHPLLPDVPRVTDDDPNTPSRKDPDGLRNDPRLRVQTSATLTNPTVAETLQPLQVATGVRLGFNELVSRKRPAFGILSWKNRAAWTVMVQVAESKGVAGHWEKDGDGYRLIGTVVHDDETPSRLSAWLWLLAAPLGLGVGAGVWLAVRRRRLSRIPDHAAVPRS